MQRELYRLRPIQKVLGSHQELVNQTIFFSDTKSLNDPMEGFREFFWKGDAVVWRNLFRNYIYCVYETLRLIRIFGNTIIIGPEHIPLFERLGDRYDSTQSELFESICNRVFTVARLDELIHNLACANRPARRDDLVAYLRTVHPLILHVISQESDNVTEPLNDRELKRKFRIHEKFHNIPTLIDSLIDKAGSDGQDFIEATFGWSRRSTKHLSVPYRSRLHSAHNPESDLLVENVELIVLDFPETYVDRLEILVYPDWYVASFMSEWSNSSVWGHYADNHSGVCLIFDVDHTSERMGMVLNMIVGTSSRRDKKIDEMTHSEEWGKCKLEFQKVIYDNKMPEVNFFRSIGVLSEQVLYSNWYSSQDGTRSECSDHLDTNASNQWRQRHWEEFKKGAVVKTKDWMYEKEYRLVLENSIVDLREERKRTLTYDFSSLKGIIFGIRTAESDKIKIMNILQDKCRALGREDFELYQAFYSYKSNGLARQKLMSIL